MNENENEIRKTSEELNNPSAPKLYRVLQSRGSKASRKEVDDFVRTQSERQVQAPPYKFQGKIAAHELNDRWFVDLIDFTAAPSDGGQKTALTPTKDGEKYVLVVQDVFSRKLFTRALMNKRPETVATAFREILDEAGAKPNSCTSDMGAEFGSSFVKMLEREGIRAAQKDPQDKNAIASIDVAIGNLKKAMARDARKHKTDDWADRLKKVTAGQNSLPNDDYLEGVAPDKVESNNDLRAYLREKNAAFSAHNQRRAEKRGAQLEGAGKFRVAEEKGTFARGFKPGWSNQVHEVKSVDGAKVTDTKGKEFLTKFTRPVSVASDYDDSESKGAVTEEDRPAQIEKSGSAQTEAKKRKHLQPWAEAVVKWLDGAKDKSMTLQRLGTILNDKPDFRKAALESGISMKTPLVTFLRVYPERFIVDTAKKGGAIVTLQASASSRPTETLAPFLKRLRRVTDTST